MIPRLLLPLLLLLSAATAGAGEWLLYHAGGEDTAALTARVTPLLPQGVSLQLRALPRGCATEQEARLQADALAAGVTALPCLVLCDAAGSYAALPLSSLSAEQLRLATALAREPGRSAAAHRRELTARLFLLRYSLSRASTPAEQEAPLARLRELMLAADTPADLRQLIGLHCLYPALMQRYAAAYYARGAHTPETESLLLQAISALETARDTDRDSALGRRAHAERERLRAARLKSRQYE